MIQNKTIKRIATVTPVLATIVAMNLVSPIHAEASEVDVVLTSGRTFTAAVDVKTDADRLWLRFASGSTVILRPIKWEAVEQVRHDGRDFTAESFREIVGELKTEHDWNAARASSAVAEEMEQLVRDTNRRSDAELAAKSLGFSKRIAAVHAEAHLANWDADVEHDGLVVHVFPLNDFGQPAAVRGKVEIKLVGRSGEPRPAPQARLFAQNGATFPVIASWTRQAHPKAIGPFGLVYRLEFQGRHPQFDPRLLDTAIVNVRLVAPGHGVFEDATAPVAIRPVNPIRDERERRTRSRFFPHEQTGRSKRAR